MVEALKSTQNNDDTIKKIVLSKEGIKTFIKKELYEFVSSETVNFFSKFKISADFIDFHPDSWKEREDYKKEINILTELSVTNDVAERGVKLIQEYNSILTKDENQKQFLLQVIQNLSIKDSSLWKDTKKLLNHKQPPPPIRNSDNTWATSDTEKANVFSSHLANVFKSHDICPNQTQLTRIEQSLNSSLPMALPAKYTSPGEVMHIIKNFQLEKHQATT
ncbi:hypothetical protein QTP88_028171 [Uroleucon formosanum]